MTVPQSTTVEPPLWREGLSIARYYLGNRWVLIALGGAALVAGIGLNWGWLVAVGLAPIILSTLPCLVMCGLGVCMMCRSNKSQSVASHDAADPATSSAALGVAKIEQPSVGGSSCCQRGAIEAQSPQVKQVHGEHDGHNENDEADEPDDRSLRQHDEWQSSERPVAEEHAFEAGEEGMTEDRGRRIDRRPTLQTRN